ncbi:ATP-binding SpoIIE family protein phosphatase [Marinobacterium jannaschii]|uniref:ATP-binding SpoIIE family protein phosphatase n=1 Tax=Marinobacterium jannaschii TaxID=64970 RepID=UPI0006864E2C|nr:SpoIIE family protein phosphatase [Marinobacterium jannaschii]
MVSAVTVQETGKLPLALIVDDSLSNRMTLEAMLRIQGFEVITAENGESGVNQFRELAPELVLMDVQMPVLDGIEATRQIKSHAGDNFVPVIFVTSSEDEEIVKRCIDAGGDDFFQRPFSPSTLNAKIKALRRIGNLYNEVRGLNSLREREEDIAEQLFSNAIESGNVADSKVRIYKRPAATFSGDVQLTAFRPNGDLNVLLGDFTGHGLTSVIGALPLSETFRAMTRKGYSGEEILLQINRKLHGLLPSGMFLAASFVTLDVSSGHARIWNCGMPEILLMDGRSKELKKVIPSADPPLGILSELDLTPVENVQVNPEDRILLMSDGVHEARSPKGEMFGEERLLMAANKGMKHGNLMDQVVFSVGAFMAGRTQDDDVSLIEVPGYVQAPPQSFEQVGQNSIEKVSEDEHWKWSIVLRGGSLKRVNPVPLLLGQLQELEGPGEHWQHLFTVVTELFVNALDHGVLGLDSSLKSSPEGFAEYFQARESRLENLSDGYVKIRVSHAPIDNGGRLMICMQDSGKGFDHQAWLEAIAADKIPDDGLSGRGIKLLMEMCESISYSEEGSRVDVSFAWSNS